LNWSTKEAPKLLYSILIHDFEAEVESWTRREDAIAAARHAAVQQELAAEGAAFLGGRSRSARFAGSIPAV
jgi:hypothetical protein